MVGIKVLDETADDKAYFAAASTAREWDPAIRARIVVERAIIRKLCEYAIKELGYSVSVFDGEEYPVRKCQDMAVIMEAVCACDEEWLVFHHHLSDRKNHMIGNVYLIYGNDGPDVIADYHVSLEPLVSAINDYAESLYA